MFAHAQMTSNVVMMQSSLLRFVQRQEEKRAPNSVSTIPFIPRGIDITPDYWLRNDQLMVRVETTERNRKEQV